ncbi:sodium/hydrogen exchanger 5 [Lampris incognitus]|uniref:sodium/hydrogen exchanger 5 n=1 Tax=Lampris incognitus TaxID=2546036 RepID=UPI0024B528B5|nr:sodium/hydrogen exchanger 5 [Lampris incognitus]
MVSVVCRVQYLEDSDPFGCTNFPEPRRPPSVTLDENLALSEQIAGIHKLLEAPLKVEECTLQLSPSGNYLDLESSLAEQRDDLELFYQDVAKGKKPILILRTQLSVRVHSILEKLYNSHGPELRRALFSLKQLFQDDKDLVPEFVASEGLTCFIKVGAEADHNYQNYILRALSQIMLFVDGMNGVINHNETVQWLYSLTGSLSRLLVKTALKLLIVFVEYVESNSPLLIQAVNRVDQRRGVKSWSYLFEILEEKNGTDTELLIFTMTLINKTLAVLPDQDSFYDVTDCLEQHGMERIIQQHLNNKGTDPDLRQQFTIYEMALRYEDGEVDDAPPNTRKERRKTAANESEVRRSHRLSSQSLPDALPSSPSSSPASSSRSSPLPCELSSPTSTPSGSLRASPLPPPTTTNGTAEPEPNTASSSSRSFLMHQLSSLGLSRRSRLFSKTGSISEAPSPSPTDPVGPKKPPQLSPEPPTKTESKTTFNPDDCNVNPDKPVLRRFEDSFLRSLAASQWEKKRRSLHATKHPDPASSSEDVAVMHLPLESCSGATPTEGSSQAHSDVESVGAAETQEETQTSQSDPVFHFSKRFTTVVPESCMLILLGLVLGGVVLLANKKQLYQLEPVLFFLFLLPTIVADAGYFMPARLFFDNLGAILLYAVVGTLWNAFCTGFCLYGVKLLGVIDERVEAGLMEFLLFGALISAVDPVAVLAVFEEVHVNETLFIIVFGESLLNDAVTVVLYKVYISFVEVGPGNVQTADYFKGVVSFLVVSVGGTLVGLVFAVVLGFITRFTKKVRIIEPLFVFLLVYLAYLTAELFSLSAILSLTFCGIGANKYVEANISQKSRTTVKYTMKTLASIAETIIFIFLGISAVDKSKWAWDTGLVSCTLIFIFIFRAAGVIGQTWILNRFRLVPLDKIDQVVMSYGGLRGAVAFALVVLLDGAQVKAKDYFVATTIVVVFFTVMFQGLTIKPLVKWLKVPRATNRKPTINEEIHERAFDHILTAVEDIAGLQGYHHWRDKWEQFDKKYLSKLLLRKSVYHKSELWEAYQKINIRDAISIIDQGGNVLTSARLSLPSMASRASFPEVTNVTNYLRENGSGVCLDLQVIDNVPGAKVEEETETHHVLAGNLYKPRRRYQSHYSRHFMMVGEKERQDREVFQRNMKNRMETFKSVRHKRHKKERSQRKRRGSDAKEQDGNEKPRRNVSWHDKDPVMVPMQSEEEKGENSEHERDEDVGITFVARTAEKSKERPRSVPAALETCQSPSALAPPSPTCGEKNLPWKGVGGSQPPCVSVEATKIIPIDLQQAWNQSISSLESISSPVASNEPLHPRVSALSRLGGPRPASYTPPSSIGSAGSTSSIGASVAHGSTTFHFPRKEEEEEEGGGLSEEQQAAQPLMSSLRPTAPPPPPPPGSAPGLGRRKNPCVYLRSLVTAPPPGSSEVRSRGPTQL